MAAIVLLRGRVCRNQVNNWKDVDFSQQGCSIACNAQRPPPTLFLACADASGDRPMCLKAKARGPTAKSMPHRVPNRTAFGSDLPGCTPEKNNAERGRKRRASTWKKKRQMGATVQWIGDVPAFFDRVGHGHLFTPYPYILHISPTEFPGSSRVCSWAEKRHKHERRARPGKYHIATPFLLTVHLTVQGMGTFFIASSATRPAIATSTLPSRANVLCQPNTGSPKVREGPELSFIARRSK